MQKGAIFHGQSTHAEFVNLDLLKDVPPLGLGQGHNIIVILRLNLVVGNSRITNMSGPKFAHVFMKMH